MGRSKLRVWMVGLVAVLVAAAIGLGPVRVASFAAHQSPAAAHARVDRARVLRLTVIEFRRAPVKPGVPASERERVEKTLLDLTAALPLVEFVLLSGVEALPQVKKLLGDDLSEGERRVQVVLTLVEGIDVERAQKFVDSLKDMKSGTEVLLVRIEDEAEIRVWVE